MTARHATPCPVTRFAGAAAVLLALTAAGCHAGKNDPGRTYAPDMAYSQAYEPYAEAEWAEGGMSAFLPPEGTVPYGESIHEPPVSGPWPFPNYIDTTGRMAGVHAYTNPVEPTPGNLAEGSRLYAIYCGICHGVDMQGQGYLVKNTPYALVPASMLEDRFLTTSDGYIYHVIQYGRGGMGSYAYAMTREQRWMVVNWIRDRQATFVAGREEAAAEAEAGAPADTVAATHPQ